MASFLSDYLIEQTIYDGRIVFLIYLPVCLDQVLHFDVYKTILDHILS